MWVESYEELAGEVFGVKAYRATQVGVEFERTYLKLASRIVYMHGSMIMLSQSAWRRPDIPSFVTLCIHKINHNTRWSCPC